MKLASPPPQLGPRYCSISRINTSIRPTRHLYGRRPARVAPWERMKGVNTGARVQQLCCKIKQSHANTRRLVIGQQVLPEDTRVQLRSELPKPTNYKHAPIAWPSEPPLRSSPLSSVHGQKSCEFTVKLKALLST